ASSAFPAIFSPVRASEIFPGAGHHQSWIADGGMFDNLPFLPAIDLLAQVQSDYRAHSSPSAAAFLRRRHAVPDLFVAGALNVNPETQAADAPFDNLLR